MTDTKKYNGTTSATDWTSKESAPEFTAYQFDQEDLVQLTIEPPKEYDENSYGGETWAYQVCSGFGDTLYAPDYETGAASISVLILRADLDRWEESCKDLGCEYDISWEVEAGHYGSGNYGGVEIAQAGSKFFWIEND